ncbi:MAG TPA: HEAT repeat domain-containing protein [Gemmataceae bacterium]|nr:HEAT repeat domain-containing protein [Gemmataceae bacterium]
MHRLTRHWRILLGWQFLAVLTAILWPSGCVLAQAFPSDPVEQLRRTLKATDSELIAQDKQLAQQLETAKPEDLTRTRLYNEARERLLTQRIDALRNISDMRLGLQLQDWNQDLDSPDERTLVTKKVRAVLANRFKKAIRDALHYGSTTARLAAMNLLAESGVLIRTADDTKLIGRGFGPDLADIVQHGNLPVVQETAARALGQVFPAPQVAVPALRKLLESPLPAERRAAASGLLGLIQVVSQLAVGYKSTNRPDADLADVLGVVQLVLPAASQGLSDRDAEVRRLSAQVVQEAAAALVNQIPQSRSLEESANTGRAPGSEKSAELLQRAAEALRNAAPAVARALRDPDPAVRLEAQRALEKMGTARQRFQRLIESTGQQQSTRLSADEPGARSGQPGKSAAPDALLEALQIAIPALKADLQDPNVLVRLGAVDVLEALGQDAAPATPDLVERLGDKDVFVRWASARTLGKITSAAKAPAIEGLSALLFDTDLEVRLAAASALQRYGPLAKPAVPDLIRAMRASDAEMRVAAMRTLETTGKAAQPGIPALATALRDPDPRVRQAAAEVLGKFGPLALSAEVALRRSLSDDNPDVRRAASDALLDILRPIDQK